MGRYIEEDENGNRYIVDDGNDFAPVPTPTPERRLPFASSSTPLGADYDASLGSNIIKGITDSPAAAIQMGGDIYDLATSPIDTIRSAGAEKTARTVGGLAAGTAGAAALAPIGASLGLLGGPIAPLTSFLGGALGGGLGFAGGLLGFDFATDATSGEIKPVEQYAKDLAYNTSQGAVFGGAGEAAFRGAPAAVRKIKEPFTKEYARAKAYNTLETLEPGYAAKIDAALSPQGNPAMAGPMPDPFQMNKSLGELIGSDNLKAIERAIPRGEDVTAYGRAAERYKARNDSQLKFLEQIEPSPITPADAQAAIKGGVASEIAAKEAAVNAAQTGVEGTLSKLKPEIDLVEAGSAIREGVAESLASQRGKVTENFTKASGGIIDPAPVNALVASELPKYFKEVGAQPNSELTNLISSFKREGEVSSILGADGQPVITERPYTVQDMQALRSQAIKIVKSGDARSSGVAGKIVGAIDEALDKAVEAGTLPKEILTSLKEGIEGRRLQGELFESKGTPAKAILGKEYSGNYTVPDSAIPNKYWRPGEKGTREAMQNYKRTFGNTPEALDPIYRYATDSFRRAAVNGDGIVNAKKAREWLNQHAEVLKEAPEIRSQFETVEKAQAFLNEKFGDLKRTQAEVEKGALQFWLKDVDPKVAVNEMLSGKDMIRRTVSTTEYLKSKDPEAVMGLRRGVIEWMKDKVYEGSGKVSVEEASLPNGPQFDGRTRDALLGSTWNKIRPALERSKLFTESQMKGFDQLYKEKASQLSVEKAKMPGGSDTAQNLTTLQAIKDFAGNAFLNSFSATKYLMRVAAPILRQVPKQQYLAALEEAIFNPRIARDLQNKPTPKNITRSVQQVFRKELGEALGAAPMAPVVGSDQKEPLSAPISRKPLFPKQQEVTANKTFPSRKELLSPPVGKLKKSSFDTSGLSPETRARIAVESSGNPDAVSPKGAQGLSQLMPDTAREIAAKLGEVYMPITPGMSPEMRQASIEQNIRFGDYYFKEQLKKYGDVTLARAAYNAGPRRVDDAIKLAGTSRDVNKILSALPKGVQKETIPYVDLIAQKYGRV